MHGLSLYKVGLSGPAYAPGAWVKFNWQTLSEHTSVIVLVLHCLKMHRLHRASIGFLGSVIIAYCVYRIFIPWSSNVTLWYYEMLPYSSILLYCEGIAFMLLAMVGGALVHISSVTWSDHLNISSIAVLYITYIVSMSFSFIYFRSFKQQTKHFRKTQEQFILKGLNEQRNTVYGKDFHFSKIHSLQDLKAKHPLTTYSHYEKYVDRICNGELNVMTKEKPIRLTITSGTTGKGKKIPYTEQSLLQLVKPMRFLAPRILSQMFPGQLSPLQQKLLIYTAPKSRPLEGGIRVGPGFMIEQSYKKYLIANTTPPSGFFICTEFEACYVHMLFGIRDRYLKEISAAFTPALMAALKILEEHWEQMLNDIETGSLYSKLDLPLDIREDLEQHIRGTCNPDRVQFLRKEFKAGFDDICRRIWPRLRVITSIDLCECAETLKKTYTKGIPIVPQFYLSTEGLHGINVDVLKPPPYQYVLLPNSLMFEFIPVQNSDEENPETYFGDEVKVGENYEMVLTNWTCGLYRFRFGDVIKVVKFYNQCPVIEFQYRYGQLMSIRGEKVDEACLFEAVKKTLNRWPGLKLVDYACAESLLAPDSVRRPGPDYYMIFIEVEGSENVIRIASELPKYLDVELCEQACLYKRFRDNISLGPVDVQLVKPGGFANLKRYIIENSTASVNQFKQPRKLKTSGVITCILNQTLST
ncbi:probable indole-3-acetic acid-amido synthetase GH3.9 [Anneissia japonica]|uniref:probable indole-3-acetic acid-amido synthetase GH3.9 n=1 Tax=Anneissia japonica TaxID=1529436 RepID=UPI001425B095|nr:probable indole-3-acetic acid-amido synthetase GH3.9 [Anneissia japonica]